jgi:leucyl aminopeptidase
MLDKIISQTQQQTTIVKTVFLARDLINEPANNSRSTRFLKAITKYISSNKLPVKLDILDKAELEKLGMGLLLAVGKGSSPENSPKLAILKYTPKHGNQTHQKPEYILLGKGITYDTGGMDLKRRGGMIEMKSDLSGAASVMAFLLGYAQLDGSKCIYAICPFAENSIGPNAVKPSDVVTAYDKRTVEITDTDAEGRLVLADCLAYAVDKYPHAKLIDFATLTGEQERVSGKMFSCMLGCNSDKEMDKLILAGEEINEPLVKIPILDKQINKLESYVADIKNVNFSSQADIIMSSLFMKQFIKKTTQWIHIDIAGPSYKLNDIVKYASPEASGIGVRLLFQYFC